jgi:hypothetical protein
MSNFEIIPLKVVLKAVLSKNTFAIKILSNLSKFRCEKDSDVQTFVQNKIVEAEESSTCRSYIFVSTEKSTLGQILAFFSVAISSVNISKSESSIQQKWKDGKIFSKNNNLGAYLLGQLAKNSAISDNPIHLQQILDHVMVLIKELWVKAAGKILALDAYPLVYVKNYKKFNFQPLREITGDQIAQDEKLYKDGKHAERKTVKLFWDISNPNFFSQIP